MNPKINFKTTISLFYGYFLAIFLVFGQDESQNKTQNLVANSSFEKTSNCLSKKEVQEVTINIPSLRMAEVAHWNSASESGTADIFQVCFDSTNGDPEFFGTKSQFGVPKNQSGWQKPHSGENYAGIYMMSDIFKSYNYREYLVGELIKPLEKGKTYTVAFWCSLSDNSNLASDAIGLYFSKKAIKYPRKFSEVIEIIPHIKNPKGRYLTNKNNWVKVSGKYQAKGGEKHIVIGNFRPHTAEDYLLFHKKSLFSLSLFASSYYFVDDVCVSEDKSTCFSDISGTIDLPKDVELLPYTPNAVRVRGTILEKDTEKPIITNVSFWSKGKIQDTISTNKQGKLEYLADTSNHHFAFIEHPNYFPKAVHFSRKVVHDFEAKLIPLKKGNSAPLVSFYSSKNGVHHVPYADEELEVWAKFLQKKSTLKIEIKSYGLSNYERENDPIKTKEENQKILNRLALQKTKKRSREIAQKLITLGVSERQISFGGYGNETDFMIFKTEIEWIENLPLDSIRKDTSSIALWKIKDMKENDKIRLKNIYFRANSAELTLSSLPTLQKLADFLQKNPTLEIAIHGHTDNGSGRTSATYLLNLSEQRADAVKQFLVKTGIDTNRLQIQGFGMKQPIADNTTEAGKQKNRRTEFMILKK